MIAKQVAPRTVQIGPKQLNFEQDVQQIVELPERVIVRLLVDDFVAGDPLVGRNVLAYDLNGDLLWRIEDSGMRRGAKRDIPEAYFWIGFRKNKLKAAGVTFSYDLDPETGKVSNPVYKH